MIPLFALFISLLMAATNITDMSNAPRADFPPGSHNLMAILNTLPSSNFQSIEENWGIAVDSAFWAGILYEGQSSDGKFKTDSCDWTAGMLVFSRRFESGVDRFILKVYVNQGSEVLLWSEESVHDGKLESLVRLWDLGPGASWKDCTPKRLGKPMLPDLYPGLEIEADMPLQAHYRFKSDQVVFGCAVQEFPIDIHEQMLDLLQIPELRYKFERGRFVEESYQISQIESYFYGMPDAILEPLTSYLGIEALSREQFNPSFRKWVFQDSEYFRDRVLAPANGYLAFGTNTDGGGKFFSMTYWKQSNGEHLVGIVITDWSLCCAVGTLRFFRPSDKGWLEVTDEVSPSLALGDLPWLKGKHNLSGEELELQAFDINLPQKGKDIRLSLDIEILEDAFPEGLKAKGIDGPETYKEHILKWQDGKFDFL